MTDPARTALVMIECQRGVVGDLSVLPDLAAAAGPVLETIGRLAREARRAGVTVVHLTYAPLAEGRSTNLRSPVTRATASTSSWGPERPGAEVVRGHRSRTGGPGVRAAPGHLPGPSHRSAQRAAQHGHRRGGRDRRLDQSGRSRRRGRRVGRGFLRGRRLRRHHRRSRVPPPSPCSGTRWPSWPACARRTSWWPPGGTPTAPEPGAPAPSGRRDGRSRPRVAFAGRGRLARMGPCPSPA